MKLWKEALLLLVELQDDIQTGGLVALSGQAHSLLTAKVHQRLGEAYRFLEDFAVSVRHFEVPHHAVLCHNLMLDNRQH